VDLSGSGKHIITSQEFGMFGSDKNNNASPKRLAPSSTKDGGVTILTSGCHFAGKLYCKGATRIGGTIEGEVIAEGLLIVEEDAVINATVKAEEIVVHGRMEGNLTVQRKIEMCATADVQADIVTPNLLVQEGAVYNGRTTMKRAVQGTDANKRDGKELKDAKGRKFDAPKVDSDNDRTPLVAARVPDISMA
jgi:cytoskeletal protein CcmA (bactofilin family)